MRAPATSGTVNRSLRRSVEGPEEGPKEAPAEGMAGVEALDALVVETLLSNDDVKVVVGGGDDDDDDDANDEDVCPECGVGICFEGCRVEGLSAEERVGLGGGGGRYSSSSGCKKHAHCAIESLGSAFGKGTGKSGVRRARAASKDSEKKSSSGRGGAYRGAAAAVLDSEGVVSVARDADVQVEADCTDEAMPAHYKESL